jgi:hypothetical protein
MSSTTAPPPLFAWSACMNPNSQLSQFPQTQTETQGIQSCPGTPADLNMVRSSACTSFAAHTAQLGDFVPAIFDFNFDYWNMVPSWE